MTQEPRIFLNVIIPGPPVAQKRHRWGRGRTYDASGNERKIFQGQLQAACPRLKPELLARMGVRITVWTEKANQDVDNFAKFYMDAMSPPPPIKQRKGLPRRPQLDPANAFAVWGNDRQVDELVVRVHRGAIAPRVQILVYELLGEGHLF